MLFLRLAGAYLILVCLHAPDLTLPYFWDEAGYFIPAAVDLFHGGHLLPVSVSPVPHPPLVAALLGLTWWIAGVSVIATRLAMLCWATAACWGIFELGRRTGGTRAGWLSAVCLALYPVFFTQTTLAQLDVPAVALSLWALVFYFDRQYLGTGIMLCLAILAKETTVVCPLTILLLEILWPVSARREWRMIAACLAPVALFSLWMVFVHHHTGYLLGNAAFEQMNLGSGSLTPARLVAAVGLRIWHCTGHVFLFGLTLPGCALAVASPVVRERFFSAERRFKAALVLCVCAQVAAFSLIGGPLLARYVLTAAALVIVLGASVLAAWSPRNFLFLSALPVAALTAGLILAPPYHCAYEDTPRLYRAFIKLHQLASARLEALGEPVITTWPASDELSKPALGYVTKPLRVVVTADLSAESLRAARSQCSGCPIFLFPTQYEPPDSWLRPGRFLGKLSFWKTAQSHLTSRPARLLAAELAQAVNGQIVWEKTDGVQYAAVVR